MRHQKKFDSILHSLEAGLILQSFARATLTLHLAPSKLHNGFDLILKEQDIAF